MKIFIKIIFFYFILITISFASCDFKKLKFGLNHPGGFDLPDKGHFFEKIYGEHICNDKNYHNLTFQGEFLDGKLISANLRQVNVPDDFLENLIYFYGEPSSKSTIDSVDGIDYYYWNLSDKQIILKFHKSSEGTATNLVITESDYLEMFSKIEEIQ